MYGTYTSEATSARGGGPHPPAASASQPEPSPFRYDVQAGDTLERIAAKLNTTTARLHALNPLLQSSSSSSSASRKPRRVKLYPGQQLVVEEARQVSLPPPPECIDNGWGQMHLVRGGETLHSIAAGYNTSAEMLRQDNRQYFPAGERGVLFPGQLLHIRRVNIGELEPEEEIPSSSSASRQSSPMATAAATSDASAVSTYSKYKMHVLTAQDTFESLCQAYSITYTRLLQINRGRFPVGARAELVVGEQLIVPDLEASRRDALRRNVAEVRLTKQIHVVAEGETPQGIAQQYGMSYDELREFNRAYFPKGYRGEIRPGFKLVVRKQEEEEEEVVTHTTTTTANADRSRTYSAKKSHHRKEDTRSSESESVSESESESDSSEEEENRGGYQSIDERPKRSSRRH